MRSTNLPGRPTGLLVALTLVALCAMTASTASAAVPGVERIVATSLSNSDDKGVTAECPDGKVLLGGGGEISGGLGEVLMDDMAPVPFEKKFTVYGYEDQDGGVDYTPNWTVTAYAICSSPLSGLERRVSTSDTDSSDKSATVQCSSFNKILLSSSGKITGGLGEVGMEDINPLAFLGTSVMAREEDPYSPDWTTTAHAICADPGGLGLGAQVRVQSVRDSSPPNSATARCPLGQVLVGVGGRLIDPTGEAVMDDIRPSADLSEVTVTAYETDPYLDSWHVEAVANCFTR